MRSALLSSTCVSPRRIRRDRSGPPDPVPGPERVESWPDGDWVVRRIPGAPPGLVTVTAGIAEPRYASLKGIMAARSKEIKQIGIGDLGIEPGEPAETVEGVSDAVARKAGAVIQDDGTAVDKIIQALVDAKVL